MYETRVNQNTANRVSSWTQPVRSGFSPIGLFIGANTMKRIKLTQGKFALVDDADFDWLNQFKWHATKRKKTFYARHTTSSKKAVYMHRMILNTPKGKISDHKDGNGLHNYRSNLRLCTHMQNHWNQQNFRGGASKYKGVTLHKGNRFQNGRGSPLRKKRYIAWQSRIFYKNKYYSLGYFNDEIEAAKAYDVKAKELFGEFAYLNFSCDLSAYQSVNKKFSMI